MDQKTPSLLAMRETRFVTVELETPQPIQQTPCTIQRKGPVTSVLRCAHPKPPIIKSKKENVLENDYKKLSQKFTFPSSYHTSKPVQNAIVTQDSQW